MNDASEIPAPLEITGEYVRPEWIDHNGHMNVAYYLLAFDESSDHLLNLLGLTRAYKQASNTATFVGDFHIRYLRELLVGDRLRITHQVLACDAKRVHFCSQMYHESEGYLAAQAEVISLHIDMSRRRVAAMSPEVLARARAVQRAHASLERPDNIGRRIGIGQPA